jgi:hypothetical protein
MDVNNGVESPPMNKGLEGPLYRLWLAPKVHGRRAHLTGSFGKEPSLPHLG